MARQPLGGRGARYALGLDVGTSAVKATLVSEDARVVEVASSAYGTSRPAPGRTEQDPAAWWDACAQALGRLLRRTPRLAGADVVVGLTGQMHTAVLRDGAGAVVRPAILWSDERATAEAAALRSAVPAWADIAGNPPIAAFTASHLAWVAAHEPEELARVRTVSLVKDDVRRRLGGDAVTEPSDASGTGLLDVRTDTWSPELMAAAGVRPEWFADVVGSDSAAGAVTRVPDGAEALLGAPLVAGAGDQAAQALALGVRSDGDVGISVGSSGAVFAASSRATVGAFRHAAPGTWLVLDSVHAAGSALTWWSRIGSVPIERMGAMGSARAAARAPIFLPHLQGHRSGDGVPAALSELRIEHGAEEIAYSVVEGVAVALARLVRSVGPDPLPPQIRLGGRAGQLESLRTVLATLLDRTIVYTPRGPAYGAAMLAAASAGWHRQVSDVDGRDAVRTEPQHRLAAQLLDRAARHERLAGRLQEVRR